MTAFVGQLWLLFMEVTVGTTLEIVACQQSTKRAKSLKYYFVIPSLSVVLYTYESSYYANDAANVKITFFLELEAFSEISLKCHR